MQSEEIYIPLTMLEIMATTIPVWFPVENESPPPLCGAVEPLTSYIAKVCYGYDNVN